MEGKELFKTDFVRQGQILFLKKIQSKRKRMKQLSSKIVAIICGMKIKHFNEEAIIILNENVNSMNILFCMKM